MINPRSSHAAFKLLLALSFCFTVVNAFGQTTSSDSPPPSSSNTVLRATDMVKITVYGEDDLTTETKIEKDGTIRFPLLGTVSLAGKSIEEASGDIRRELAAKYIRNPLVNLTVISHAVDRVTILGEVRSPGEVPIPEEGQHDLLGVVALAGGFTDVAEISHISVRRIVDGKAQIFIVDAKKMTHDSKANTFYVQPGDTITVRQRIF
jgi:polysaccharide export outer membrane protein